MPSSLSLQATHINAVDWLWIAGSLALPLGVAAWLALRGAGRTLAPIALFRGAGRSMESLTGLPAWAASGILLQTWAMLVAGIGLYWDVAWHIDVGRDTELFTPPHAMVLTGLPGLAPAGPVSAAYP